MDVSTFDDLRAEFMRRVTEAVYCNSTALGFDPQPHYGTIHHQYFGLHRFTPWRVELGNLQGEPIVW